MHQSGEERGFIYCCCYLYKVVIILVNLKEKLNQLFILVDNGDVFKLAIKKIPTFRGMKQSSREVAYMMKSVMNSENGKYQVITGNEVSIRISNKLGK